MVGGGIAAARSEAGDEDKGEGEEFKGIGEDDSPLFERKDPFVAVCIGSMSDACYHCAMCYLCTIDRH